MVFSFAFASENNRKLTLCYSLLCKLLFLTARNKSFHDNTKKQLLHIGILCEDNDIHYTNNTITKGKYIKNNIDANE
jgi:hypothetical protein